MGDRDGHMYTKYIADKNLLHIAGSSAQQSVMTYMGIESKKDSIIHSLRCTTTLCNILNNSTPVKIIFKSKLKISKFIYSLLSLFPRHWSCYGVPPNAHLLSA